VLTVTVDAALDHSSAIILRSAPGSVFPHEASAELRIQRWPLLVLS
jgi:hypothetical protein